MNIFTQTKDQYKEETYLSLKNCDNRAAITKLRPSSHNLLLKRHNDIKFLMTRKYVDVA